MDKIEELEKQLTLAKKVKIQTDIDKRMNEYNKSIGTCTSTHLLGSVRKHRETIISRISDVKYNKSDKRFYYIIDKIDFIKIDNRTSISIVENQVQSTSSGYSFFKHKIEPYVFESIFKQFKAKIDILGDDLSTSFKWKWDDYINGGEVTELSNEIKIYKGIGLKTIRLVEGWDSVYNTLRWQNCPFLSGFELVIIPKLTLASIHFIADEMEENAYMWGSSILERDLPRIQNLRKFIKKHNSTLT